MIAGGAYERAGQPTYKLEFDNAFGLVNGAQFKVAGVPAGSDHVDQPLFNDKAAHCSEPARRAWSPCR